MAYYVRLLTPSERIIPASEIIPQGKSIKLASGMDNAWEKIEIFEPEDNLISDLERHTVYSGSTGEAELMRLKDSIQGCYPSSAREWLRQYLPKVKTIYSFQLFTDNIIRTVWPTLGRVQNLLKDALSGIIQSDNEGFYNERGDYILWQMYEGASGAIPAATLNENREWISYQLKLNDAKAVEQFKQGIVPRRGFLSRLLGG
jgi:hypothetical protein